MPKSTAQFSSSDNLPQIIEASAHAMLNSISQPGIFNPQEDRILRQELNLWLASSWNLAQTMNITPEDFAEWMRLGQWNITKNNSSYKLIKDYTAIAGTSSWKIYEVGMSVQEAFDKAAESGVTALMESVETMLALKSLSEKRF